MITQEELDGAIQDLRSELEDKIEDVKRELEGLVDRLNDQGVDA